MADNESSCGKMNEDVWRIFRIMAEFVEGFETLSKVGPCVTIFGSARTPEEHPHYKLTVDTARLFAQQGYGVISGGGPGIMEAANRGAHEVGGVSIGLNIQLPFEQSPNPYIKTMLSFRYFFVRKVMFLKYTSAVIVMPGGFGTLDELFETLTLVQTDKADPMPVVLIGREYWNGLLTWLNDTMLGADYILKSDMGLIHVTDEPSEAVEFVKKHAAARENAANFI